MEASGTSATEQEGWQRREAKPWGKLALKGGGGGGLLITGGVLIAAGTAFAVGHAWKRLPSASSRPGDEIKGLYGKNREKECQIDRDGNSSSSQEKNYVPKKENGFVLPNELGEKEGRSLNPIKKQSPEEPERVLGDGMEKEIKVDLIQSHADLVRVLEKSEFILVDEVGKEEEIVSDISPMDKFEEVEESLPSESELALDNEELKKAETIITELNTATIATKEIEIKQEPSLEKTPCIDGVSELVSTAAQEIRAAATGELKYEESDSGITPCVDEIAGLVLAATEGVDIQECNRVHISAELVLDHPEETMDEEHSSNERTACNAANEILREDDSGRCIRKVDEGFRDEIVLAPTEEIKREEEILLQEPKVKIESEINQQREEEASSAEIREEPKFQLGSRQEEEDNETFSTKSEHDIEEKEDKTQSNTDDSQSEESAFGTIKEIEKEGAKLSQTEHHPQHIVNRLLFSVVKDIHKIDKEEDEAKESETSSEMREESNNIKISWTVSNTETVCPIEVIEQKKILPATELKEQKESIMVKTLYPSGDVQRERELKGANDSLAEIEEEREEQKESITAKIKTDHGFLMDHDHNRLFIVLLGIVLILGIPCFLNSSYLTELSSQLYQVVFPPVEETQQIEL